MTSYELTPFKKMVLVWKTKSLLFCLWYDPLIVLQRQNHITFIFIKTMSHDLLVQMAYCCPCCASLMTTVDWIRRRSISTFPPVASTLRPVRFSYSQRDYTLPYLSRESRPRNRSSNCLQFAGRIRNATPSWNNMADRFYFDCLRVSYLTVRSIDTIITFLPIFIIFAYITRFSFLGWNH